MVVAFVEAEKERQPCAVHALGDAGAVQRGVGRQKAAPALVVTGAFRLERRHAQLPAPIIPSRPRSSRRQARRTRGRGSYPPPRPYTPRPAVYFPVGVGEAPSVTVVVCGVVLLPR